MVWKSLSNKHILKIVRLTTICNGLKWTISARGELELLQMVTPYGMPVKTPDGMSARMLVPKGV